MNKIPVYHPGSSIALLLRARSKAGASPVILADYEAEVTVFTRLLGQKIRASTCDPDKIAVVRVDDHTLAVNIPPEETVGLPVGECSVKLTLTDKETGTALITTQKILMIEETVR